MDLSAYGFENGLISDDLNILVHAIDLEEQSSIFQTLGEVDSEALLSSSYVNYGKGNYLVFRNNGFVLDVNSDNIAAGFNENFHSGFQKNISLLKNKYLIDEGQKDFAYRKYMPDLIKKEMNLTDEEYVKLYDEISKKSLPELAKTHPETAEKLREIIKNIKDGKYEDSKIYNEFLVTHPKIQAVFNWGNAEIPDFLLTFASEHNLPVICFDM